MGAKSAPTSPSVEPNDEGHFMSPTGVCCWCQDYDDEIEVEAMVRYYRRFENNAPQAGSNLKYFKLYAGLLSGLIKVEIRFKFAKDGPVTAEQVDNAKRGLIEAAQSWNGHIAIEIQDPECGNRVLPVEFVAMPVEQEEHYIVTVFQTFPPIYQVQGEDRAHVTGRDMRVLTWTNHWTYMHEFAHCFGLPDEYGYYDEKIERVMYMRPDGTADPAIDVDHRGIASWGPEVNIMSTKGREKRAMRHGYFVAIEVQTLLRECLGREDIRCIVVRPSE